MVTIWCLEIQGTVRCWSECPWHKHLGEQFGGIRATYDAGALWLGLPFAEVQSSPLFRCFAFLSSVTHGQPQFRNLTWSIPEINHS